jgi:hypothetical protein
MNDLSGMVKAGLIFGFAMAIKERADAAVARLKKAQRREEVLLPYGVDKFRRTWRRKPALFVLR